MSILDIILMGYIVNIIGYFFVVIISMIIGVVYSQDTEFYIEMTKLEAKLQTLKDLKIELRKKGISPLTQSSFIFLLPFSGLLSSVLFISRLMNGGMIYHSNILVDREIKILKDRLINKEK